MPKVNIPIPTRLEVATSSRPRQLFVTTAKQKEKERAGKLYKQSKWDSAQSHYINWKSPTFWPMIDQAVKEQIGKPNLSEIIRVLRSRDKRFEHLTHQRLSDWRDKTKPNKFVWSEQTLEDVKKGFLPGGDQTRHNVFVSFLYVVYKPITNDI